MAYPSITPSTIGQLSLNFSFVLYLIIYLPQIKHNQNPTHLKQLSLGLHLILTTSFALDLIYSLLKPLPWQYQTVSSVALTLLLIQHLQLLRLAYHTQHQTHIKWLNLSLIAFAGLGAWYFLWFTEIKNTASVLRIGYLSRLGFLAYMLPQIVFNFRYRQAKALSHMFLNLSLLLTTLDLISAWCLQWGWPNQIGTPITLVLTLILKYQQLTYAGSLSTERPIIAVKP